MAARFCSFPRLRRKVSPFLPPWTGLASRAGLLSETKARRGRVDWRRAENGGFGRGDGRRSTRRRRDPAGLDDCFPLWVKRPWFWAESTGENFLKKISISY